MCQGKMAIVVDMSVEDGRFVVRDRFLGRMGVGKTLSAATVEWAERFARRAQHMRDYPPYGNESVRRKQETIKALMEGM